MALALVEMSTADAPESPTPEATPHAAPESQAPSEPVEAPEAAPVPVLESQPAPEAPPELPGAPGAGEGPDSALKARTEKDTEPLEEKAAEGRQAVDDEAESRILPRS